MSVRIATRTLLAYAPEDCGLARLLRDRLDPAGFEVAPFDKHRAGDEFDDQLRAALSNADSVVFLVTRQFASSEYLAVEVGAARAAGIPIFVLYDGMTESEVPDFLRRFPLYRVDEVSRFIDEAARAA